MATVIQEDITEDTGGPKRTAKWTQTLQLQRALRQDVLAWAYPARSASCYERNVQNTGVLFSFITLEILLNLNIIWDLVSSPYKSLIQPPEMQICHMGCKHLVRKVISTEQFDLVCLLVLIRAL